MTDIFRLAIQNFVDECKDGLLAVARTAISKTVNDMQTTVPEGGHMPVDTGFLWGSGASALNVMPSGASQKVKGVSYRYEGAPLVATLSQMKIGDKFYFGWTAEYANRVNYRYGWMEVGSQNFNRNVIDAINEWKSRAKR